MAINRPKNPAENLVGITLSDNWQIVEKKSKPAISTGGNFSIGYIVEKNGVRAFLKVLDITRAFRFTNFTVQLENILKSHNYECELLEACRNSRLTKIVNVLGKGEIIMPEVDYPFPIPPIPYIIFELAETNSREILNEIDQFDVGFALRTMHNVTVALKQLHNSGMVHQDTKPSNVLHFLDQGSHKLGDLGRGDTQRNDAPHNHFTIAGDPSYAPPELLYSEINSDWKQRRQACDTYHLGSLLMYYFTQSDTTGMIKSYLPSEYHWDNWGGSYNHVLPYLYEAFDQSIILFRSALEERNIDNNCVEELVWALKRLCDPDPLQRGHPKDIDSVGSSYSLHRFITIFNRWATIYEFKKN